MSAPRTLAALALALLAGLPAEPARAQTKADAFAGKIPPVSGQLYRKAGRLELTLGGNLSLNDAFFTKYFGGAKLGWHFSEAWAVSLHGAGGLARNSGSAVVCSATGGCRDAAESELDQVPGRITALGGLELGWSPVYGKLNVLSSLVAHFDLSLLVGADVILHDEVLLDADAQRGVTPASTLAPAGHVGLGARLFLSEGFALRLEVKDYVYGVTVPNNGSGKDWQHQLFTEIGASFFFPTRNRQTR